MKNYKGILVYILLGLLSGYIVSAVSFHLSMYISLLYIGFTGTNDTAIYLYLAMVIIISVLCLFFAFKLIKLLSEEKDLILTYRITIVTAFLFLAVYSRLWELDLTVFN